MALLLTLPFKFAQKNSINIQGRLL